MDTVLVFLTENGEWIVALCALGVSLRALHAQRKHDRLSVHPKLHVTKGHTASAPYKWHLKNFGVGPAVIKEFDVIVDGTRLSFPSMGGLNAALNGIGCQDFDECYGFREGEYMQASSEVILLSFPPEKADAVNPYLPKIAWRIVYESIYGNRHSLEIYADR